MASEVRRNLRISGSSSTTRIVPRISLIAWLCLARDLRRLLERQREAERSPAVRSRLRPDAATVQAHDGAADGETQPDAGDGALGIAAMELREQLLGVAVRQSRPAVLDGNEQAVVLSVDA